MAAKNPLARFQSICHSKNNATKYQMAAKKLTKPSPNIIATTKVTIPL